MLLRLREVVQWTRMTALELLLHLVSLMAFTLLMALHLEGFARLSWPTLFSPLFICDGLNAYLVIIVFLRQFREYDEFKSACVRLFNSLFVLGAIFLTKLMLCQKLNGLNISCTQAMAPIFTLSFMFLFRACRMH